MQKTSVLITWDRNFKNEYLYLSSHLFWLKLINSLSNHQTLKTLSRSRASKNIATMAEKNNNGGEPFSLDTSACNYFQDIIRAVIKCLGFDQSEPPHNSCPNAAEDDDTKSQSSSSSSASSAEQEPTDPPPSSAAAPLMAALLRMVRRPPTPPISGGSGPQTNAASSWSFGV